MASRSLATLEPGFHGDVVEVKKQFDKATPIAVTLLIYCTRRPLLEQAVLYRQGRSTQAIRTKQRKLRLIGFPELADLIDKAGPQNSTVRVTGAAPGESWHNYDRAIDAVPIQAGNLLWSHDEYYALYGRIARELGLIWLAPGDKPHIQVGIKGNPLKHFNKAAVRKMLKL